MPADRSPLPLRQRAPLRAAGTGLVLVLLLTGLVGCLGERVDAPVLDKVEQLERFDWWDNRDWDWYAGNIPFLETPDADIDATYYYRWEVLTKHLVYGAPGHGYTFTEFYDRPFWSGTYGAISCPLGHQLYEVRWLKDRRIVDDFARYWFDVPGAEPRSYSNWYADALWAIYEVTGDREWIVSMLPYMQRQWAGWMTERWDPDHRMFRWDGMHDGMETNINSRQTPQWFDGAEGYRPTLNAYLFADALAISRTAELAGDLELSANFAARAEELRDRVLVELWDPEREFFFQQFAADEETVADPWPGAGNEQFGNAAVAGASIAADGGTPPIRAKTLTYETGPWAGDPHGREAIGFVPWQFNLPPAGYEAAWRSLMDPGRFQAPFGPTTTEKGDPLYYVSPRCCVWSGNSWPYATTQTLTAMANLLNDYEQDVVTAADWFELFRNYALTHRKEGRPYVAEAADPETGSWAGHDKFFHSEHYLHSGFVDLAISGLIGLRPGPDGRLAVNPMVPDGWDWFALDDVAMGGRSLTVTWDRDGSRYGRGAGLIVRADGAVVASSPELRRLEVDLGAPLPTRSAAPRRHDFAVNNQPGWYPHASASSWRPESPPDWAVDGQYGYHVSPPNRWVPDGSLAEDWLEIDFGAERTLDEVVLYFLDDTVQVHDFVAEEAPARLAEPPAAASRPVAPPAAFRVEVWSEGAWTPVGGGSDPAGRRATRVALSTPVAASRLRIVLEHAESSVAGLSEVEAWSTDAPSPPSAEVPNFALDPRVAARASIVPDGQEVTVVHDGQAAFNYYTHGRWSSEGSASARDWLEFDLGAERELSRAEVYLWAWEARGTAAPANWGVQVWDGVRWQEVEGLERASAAPVAMALNAATFEPVTAARVRVWFEHAAGAATGVSEVVLR